MLPVATDGQTTEVFGKLSSPLILEVEPVGRWFEAYTQRLQNKHSVSHHSRSSSSSSESETDIYDDDEFSEALLLGLDPKEWKHQDHYAVLGLKNLRYKASEDQIKRAYKRKVLKHHPDKRKARGLKVKDGEDDYFTCITRAYEVLGTPSKRRAYDSVDPEFDDSVPSATTNSKENFYEVFTSVFERNARWSNKKRVPSLGDDKSTFDEVNDFYGFWYEFDSWREYSYLDEEEKEKGENRDERRWIEKQNKAARQKRKKEEVSRIRSLVDNSYACDPRIQKFKDEEKEKKLAAKRAKQEAARLKAEEEERVRREAEEEERKKKQEEEDKAKAQAAAAKKEREAQKKALKKERKTLRTVIKDYEYFASDEKERLDYMTEVDKLSEILSLTMLQALNESLNCGDKEKAKDAFLKNVKDVNDGIEREKREQIEAMSKSSGSDSNKGKKTWTEEELSFLIKAVNLFPAGTKDRWEVATSQRDWLVVYVLFSVIASRFILCMKPEKPPLNRVTQWSYKLSDFWNTYFSTLTGMDPVDRKYEFPRSTGSGVVDIQATFSMVEPATLVSDMSLKLKAMLKTKMDALQNSVDKAEDAAANHLWDSSLNKEEVKYKNAKDMMNEPLAYTERFEQKVNFSFSSVHIPVEIYDGDLEILNGLNWTSQLDKVFEENYKKDPEILWQYFGSQAGFMRTYPGGAWKNRGQVDLYDVRRQSWYTQGSSSPKDMMILIDKSGSTHGQALQLMKVAVKSILDTLGENDFVNIAAFSSEAQFVSQCFNHTPFVQATYRNKQKLSNDVNDLSANGMANFEVGLKFAFEQFENFERNETNPDPDQQSGASCNKVIMLLTDGGTDNAEEVFKEYNWPNKTVRVFTYAVGPTANPTNAIKWMACANRGYFSQIPAMGAIRTRVQNYTRALVGPKEYVYSQNFSWEVTQDPHGLGMMTTVTLPVYNRTAGSSNQTILGVMGIDVTTADMVKKSPTQKLGHNGYSFAINPNGYIIFHPHLKPTKYMRDPPNIDLLEIEVENDQKNELRTNMIKGQTGSMEIDTFVLSSDMKYVHFDKVRYSFTPIEGTSFSLGVSLPSYQTYYPDFAATIAQFNHSVFKSENWAMLIAPWDYYTDMTKSNHSGTTEDILEMLKVSGTKWDEELLNHLYWDAVIAKSVETYFFIVQNNYVSNLTNGSLSDTKGHIFTFLISNGGLTRVFPKNASSSFMNHRDPKTSHFYKRILSSDKKVFFIEPFSKPVQDGNDTIPPDVTIGKAFAIKNNSNGKTAYKPGVMGAQFMYSRVIDSLYEFTKDDFYYDCADVNFLNCYLVDEGGFLIASNQEDHNMQIGQFLGKVDPPVMTKLFNASIYNRIKHYDYQVTHDCTTEEKETSAGFSSFRIPSINLLYDALTLNWWTSKFFWAYLNFNFWNSWFSPQETYANDESWTGSAETCVEVMYQYYFGTNKTMSDTAECDNCTRTILASRMDVHTNLLLVVTDPICSECNSFFNEMPQAPVKVNEEEEKEVICDMARTPRYRKPVQGCYSKDPREDATKCGCMSSTTASVFNILLSIAVILFSVPYLTQTHS